MRWGDMRYLSVRNVLGYKYYCIVSSGRQECLWVPCNIKNKKQFMKDLESLISQEHVLLQHVKISIK